MKTIILAVTAAIAAANVAAANQPALRTTASPAEVAAASEKSRDENKEFWGWRGPWGGLGWGGYGGWGGRWGGFGGWGW